MSSLVLLHSDGTVARKLQLVSLPDNYVVPDGMTVSWKTELHRSSSDLLAGWRSPKEPVEAYLYLGNAWAQVCRSEIMESIRDHEGRWHYGSRILTIVVQGTSAKDVMKLRDHVMHLINSNARWEASNDLNPKPGLFHRLLRMSK